MTRHTTGVYLILAMNAPLSQLPACAGLLMSGGEGSRMGRDKATIELKEKPLWQRQVHTLRAAGAEPVAISRGAWPPLAGGSQVLSLCDEVLQCGPLAGLVTGLRFLQQLWTMVLAVDLPLMTPGFLLKLLKQVRTSGRGVVPVRIGRLEPLAAIYGKNCLASAVTALERRELSLQKLCHTWMQQGLVDTYSVEEEEEPLFTNLNTPEDLLAVRSALESEPGRRDV